MGTLQWVGQGLTPLSEEPKRLAQATESGYTGRLPTPQASPQLPSPAQLAKCAGLFGCPTFCAGSLYSRACLLKLQNVQGVQLRAYPSPTRPNRRRQTRSSRREAATRKRAGFDASTHFDAWHNEAMRVVRDYDVASPKNLE